MGRRCKLTPEVQERICEAVAIGATYEFAAAHGGITRETLHQWRTTKPDFSDALKAAEGRAVLALLDRIQDAAANGTWQAAAWILERRYPHAYGRTVQSVELSGPEGAPIPLSMVDKVLADAAADDRRG